MMRLQSSTFSGIRNKIAIPDPVYPVYVDTNVMTGRSGPARKDGSYEGRLFAVHS